MMFPTIAELRRKLVEVRDSARADGEGCYVLLEITPRHWHLHVDPKVRCRERTSLWTSEVVCPEDSEHKLTEMARNMLQICEADDDLRRTREFYE